MDESAWNQPGERHTFTPEALQRVRARIKEVLPHPECPLCHSHSWAVANGFVTTTLSGTPGKSYINGPSLSAIVMSCTVCGNSHFLNAILLGLGDLVVNPGNE